MQSTAPTVDAYLKTLPPDKRAVIAALREVMRKNIDKGYQEGMVYGMPGFFIPHSIYPDGYHCDPRQPLCFAGMMSQKNYFSLYLASVYCGCDTEKPGELSEQAVWFREAWKRTGKKLDMGKSCIRFKLLDDVPLEVVAEAIRRVPVKLYIKMYEKALGPQRLAKAHAAAERLRARESGAKPAARGKATGAATKKDPSKSPAQSPANNPVKAQKKVVKKAANASGKATRKPRSSSRKKASRS